MSEIYIVLIAVLAILAVSGLYVGVTNDAVNFLNSAIGSKVASLRVILIVASVGIIIGAVTGGMPASKAMYYDDQDQLIHDLRALARPGDTLLFKGSRGMKMERVLHLFLHDED